MKQSARAVSQGVHVVSSPEVIGYEDVYHASTYQQLHSCFFVPQDAQI